MKEKINLVLDLMVENELMYREHGNEMPLWIFDALSRREEILMRQIIADSFDVLLKFYGQVDKEIDQESSSSRDEFISLLMEEL